MDMAYIIQLCILIRTIDLGKADNLEWNWVWINMAISTQAAFTYSNQQKDQVNVWPG